MPDTVKFNVKVNNTSNTKPFTLNVEDKKFINSIITVGEDNTITPEQMKKLQEAAGRNGDLGILEACDLNPEEKINLANSNGYSEYYDIKLSKDGELYEVTVKKTSNLVKDPTLGTIKKDFGVRDNVFIQKGEIPYGNEDLIRNAGKNMTPDARNVDYDSTQLREGNTIRIPVEEVNIQDSPRGFWGRLCQ